MPIKVDDQFLELLQNKSLIIEVWTKMPDNQQGSDKIVGLVKLPLSFFYDKLKDSDITKLAIKINKFEIKLFTATKYKVLQWCYYVVQRCSRGHKARGQEQTKNSRPRTALPSTDPFEAKDTDASALQKNLFRKFFSVDLQKKRS